jgi:DNA-binding SARP family transcriptional activator
VSDDLQIGVLGPIEVRREGRPVTIGAAKLRVVLALLTLRAGQVVSLDALVDGLWPGLPPATAAKTLQGYVSELRRELEPNIGPDRSAIATRPPGYVLELSPESFDLMRFERLWANGREALQRDDPGRAAQLLSSALALWRGEPLLDIADEGEISLEVGRLEELRLSCTEDHIEAEIACGRHAAVTALLEQYASAHPFRERLAGQLMLALYRGGRQAEALETYRSLRERLSDELGVTPAPEMAALERSILNHEPALMGRPAAPSGVLGGDTTRRLLVVSQIEADLEPLTRLGTLIARGASGLDLTLVRVLTPGRESQPGAGLREATRQLTEHRDRLAGEGLGASVAAFASTQMGADIIKLANHQSAHLVLIDGSADLLEGRFGPAGHLLSHAPSDVALHLHRERSSDGVEVIVPFGGHEHDWAALEVGVLIARQTDRPLLLAGVTRDPDLDASRLLADASLIVQRTTGIVSEPVILAPGPDGILEVARSAQFVLLGLSARFRSEGLGETRYRIAREAACDVVFVRRGVRPGILAPTSTTTRFGWSLPIGATGR